MHIHQIEEAAAANATADRFDGFDRGDLDRDHDADRDAMNEAELEDERRATAAIAMHGEATCREAFRMHDADGEGGRTVGIYLGLTTRQADAAIDAGRWLAKFGSEA